MECALETNQQYSMQADLSRTEKVARIFAAFDSDGDGLLCKVGTTKALRNGNVLKLTTSSVLPRPFTGQGRMQILCHAVVCLLGNKNIQTIRGHPKLKKHYVELGF